MKHDQQLINILGVYVCESASESVSASSVTNISTRPYWKDLCIYSVIIFPLKLLQGQTDQNKRSNINRQIWFPH